MDREEQIKTVNSWLKDISAALGVHLTLDHEAICTFQVEDHIIALELSQDQPMVHMYSPLLALPSGDKDLTLGLLGRALEMNAFQILTRGGAIAMAPGGGFLIYCYSTPIENIDSEKFSLILEAFYETIPELKKMLSDSSSFNDGKETPGIPKGFIKI